MLQVGSRRTDQSRRHGCKVRSLRSVLDRIEEKLADKTVKLVQAKDKLTQLQTDMSEVKQRRDQLDAEANALADTITKNRMAGVSDAMYNVLMEEFKHVMANADDDTIEHFDGSLMMDFARRGNAIAQCAVMLVGGYLDQATEFAESHGGGGGGSDMKWGEIQMRMIVAGLVVVSAWLTR